MSTLAIPIGSPKSLKRTYDDAGLREALRVSPAPSAQITASSASIVPAVDSNQASPASQINAGSIAWNHPAPGIASVPVASPMPHSTQGPVKKTKLTFEEKEVQRIEREFKAREKAEEKARKEEERARKEVDKVKRDEEKAKKEEDKKARESAREDKRKAREAQAHAKLEEKRLKEEEKQKQEDAKNKKASNQLRLNSFFIQPSMPQGSSSGSPASETHSPLSSRRSSISEIHAMEAPRRSRSVSNTPQKAQLDEYKRYFQPFYRPLNTDLAPYNRFSRDAKSLAYAQGKIDEALLLKEEAETARKEGASLLHDILQVPPQRTHQYRKQTYTVKDVMAAIDGSISNPIDLTNSATLRLQKKPTDLLATIPTKYLKFSEDVRPPYIGTYTRFQNSHPISHLARNPFSRSLPKTDYDYDSEAEWEEPVEGEDLDSEGEDEPEDEEEADEMTGFLDDEEVTDTTRPVKRRPILRDQEPISTGLCWEGPEGQPPEQGFAFPNWHSFKLDILMENPKLPIDPYCTDYWLPTSDSNSLQAAPRAQHSLMEPPRFPLHPTNRQNAILPSSLNDPSAPMKAAKAHRQIATELMDDFKVAVQGNDLTKVGLLEILKKRFPKEPKEAIKDTLEMIAERVGPRPSEKKWVLKNGI